MKTSHVFDLIVAVFGLFFILPMWLFLLYSILVAIQPDRLVWFIFWAYLPLSVGIHIISGIGKAIAEAME